MYHGEQDKYGYQGSSSSQRGPPLPPPPPTQPSQWNGRYEQVQPGSRESQFRGPYSDLRQGHSRDSREYNEDNRDRDHYRPPQGDFTFRVDRPSGIDSYRPPEREQRNSRGHAPYHRPEHTPYAYSTSRYIDERDAHQHRHPRSAPGRDNQRRNDERRRPRDGRQDRGGRRSRAAPYKRKAIPAARLLLVKDHSYQPELMLGDTAGRATYRDVDELSDSDETEMDISDDSNSEVAEPASKRARKSGPAQTDSEQETPRWSNPDPYTALPPPDETTRKKKDMVHLIRKARVEAEAKKPAVQTEGLDFISCDFSDSENNVAQANWKSQTPAEKAPAETSAGKTAAATLGLTGAPSLPPKPPVSASSEQTATRAGPNSVAPYAENGPVDLSFPAPPGDSSSRLPSIINNTIAPDRYGTDPSLIQSSAPRTENNPIDLAASTALGNRKRTFYDTIKSVPGRSKSSNKMHPNGEIVSMWQAREGDDPRPWAVNDHSETLSAGARLHKEIVDFFKWIQPQEFEQEVRKLMVRRLTQLIQKRWGDSIIYPFGSYMSSMYLPTGDMDIAVCSKGFARDNVPKYNKRNSLYVLKAHLLSCKAARDGNIEVIAHAKVPLLKYIDEETGLKVDVSFEKLDGAKAVPTFKAWKQKYPAMPILVTLVKQFLLMRGLNEPVNGGIGGFSVICMVVHLLSQMPQLQSGSMKPEQHLGETFMEFLDYYGNRFDYETVAIRMDPPGLVPKDEVSNIPYRNTDRLSIIDPNNGENDIAGGSSNTATILRTFSAAHSLLQDRMVKIANGALNGSDQTLLGPLFAGYYRSFVDQRQSMKRLAARGLQGYMANVPARPRSKRPARDNRW
ncbi:hypothetical protein GGR52DRAFT_554605 [Hypoxylon sp. FL1284]|nr:hypothetical protein GGR52DRAFT_554605 [Hypoxylon sp. FL1284]